METILITRKISMIDFDYIVDCLGLNEIGPPTNELVIRCSCPVGQ
jgi:hypothetical protein